jgi:hypothetical protein
MSLFFYFLLFNHFGSGNEKGIKSKGGTVNKKEFCKLIMFLACLSLKNYKT